MKIGFTYNLKTDWRFREQDPRDACAEFDKPETVDSIARALEACGHEVVRIGNVNHLLARLDQLDVDIVFNICEGEFGRNRESQVPVILEMNRIPFIGADGLTLGLTLDKVMAKKCFIADGIPTPRFFSASDSRNLELLNVIGFPLMVKTSAEGTSKGITDASRVESLSALKQQVDLITRVYHQPALVEEFIRGQEFTVAVLGNNPPQAMPVVQVSIENECDLGDKFFTYDMVINEDIVTYVCPARIPAALTKTLQELAVRAYRSVDCRDFGRVDFRVDPQGRPYVLEINPLPSLARNDVFNVFPQHVGMSYQEVLDAIVHFGLERYGLVPEGSAKLCCPTT